MSNQQSKEKELCDLYINLLHKNRNLFCIFTTFLNVRHDAVKVPRSCAQIKCVLCVTVVLN